MPASVPPATTMLSGWGRRTAARMTSASGSSSVPSSTRSSRPIVGVAVAADAEARPPGHLHHRGQAGSVGQPEVEERAGVVEAALGPPAVGGDPPDELDQIAVGGRQLRPPLPSAAGPGDEDPVAAVGVEVLDGRIGEQLVEQAEAVEAGPHVGDQRGLLVGADRRQARGQALPAQSLQGHREQALALGLLDRRRGPRGLPIRPVAQLGRHLVEDLLDQRGRHACAPAASIVGAVAPGVFAASAARVAASRPTARTSPVRRRRRSSSPRCVTAAAAAGSSGTTPSSGTPSLIGHLERVERAVPDAHQAELHAHRRREPLGQRPERDDLVQAGPDDEQRPLGRQSPTAARGCSGGAGRSRRRRSPRRGRRRWPRARRARAGRPRPAPGPGGPATSSTPSPSACACWCRRASVEPSRAAASDRSPGSWVRPDESCPRAASTPPSGSASMTRRVRSRSGQHQARRTASVVAPGAPFPLAVAQITTRSRRAPAAAAGGPRRSWHRPPGPAGRAARRRAPMHRGRRVR